MALKANQPNLLTSHADSFALATALAGIDRTIDKHHSPVEVRVCETISNPEVLALLDPERRWRGSRTTVRVTATRWVGEQEPEPLRCGTT